MTNRALQWPQLVLLASAISLFPLTTRADEAKGRPVDPGNVPAPTRLLVGPYRGYQPQVSYKKGVEATIYASVSLRGEGVSTFPVDKTGTGYQNGFAFSPQVRVGAYYDTLKKISPLIFRLEYEQDLPTGFVTSGDRPSGSELPDGAPITTPLRKLMLHFGGRYFRIAMGATTNHFGLGLLANDGSSSNWTPGSARFADNRGGDRVGGGYIATGPLTDLGIVASFGGYQVLGDDILLPGDKANQLIASVSVGHGKKTGAGLFFVHRELTTQTGGVTNVNAFDLTARHENVGPHYTISVEAEAAIVYGLTTVAATPEIPVQDILQFGTIVRGAVRTHHGGAVLDVLYASGDNNPYDKKQTAFRADPNLETGLLLYRYVLAAQTGRATATAGDPNLVGVASQGLERIPTRGSPTNTLAIFPRFYVRPLAGLEVYGGPLLAFSMAPLYDPLNTRTAGGVVKNALGGTSGQTLGLEMDLGVRQRMLIRGMELTVGLEGGMLLPGNAFADAKGTPMSTVYGGRGLVQHRF
ncbi:MAG TPA: hypothetical protein PK156_28550 [Polyangium sp.]|nr:hypothetical protein [Polyangium sp.]